MRIEEHDVAEQTTLHALRGTLERVNQVGYGFLAAQAGDPTGEGWVGVSDLIADPGAYVPNWLERYARTMGTEDRRVTSSFFFKTYR